MSGLEGLEGATLSLNVPEAVGDADRPEWFHSLAPTWRQDGDRNWTAEAVAPGELAYRLGVQLGTDGFDLSIWIENRSGRTWRHAAAFPCVLVEDPRGFRDLEGRRTWVSVDGRTTTIDRLPRTWSSRPGVQVYPCAGGPPVEEVGFAAAFGATSSVEVGDWMALVDAADRRTLVARSDQAGFLFHNLEYSCIHSCPVSGAVAPGGSWEATTEVWLTTPDELHDGQR